MVKRDSVDLTGYEYLMLLGTSLGSKKRFMFACNFIFVRRLFLFYFIFPFVVAFIDHSQTEHLI